MANIPQPYLFSWREIEADSDLNRLCLVMSVLPDEHFVRFLELLRGKGRDDYPIRPTWNALMAGIVYQHESAAGLLRELRRNAELRELCGFNPLLGVVAVPTDDAFGHFLALVMDHQDQLLEIFDQLIDELKRLLPGLGGNMAVDSKAIQSYGRPVKNEDKKEEVDRRRDTDADWGTKTYKGTRKDGTKWEKTVRWFGYKLHLLVDSAYELPMAFELTKASAGDSPQLLPLVEQLRKKHPELVERCDQLAADKGYDSTDNNEQLHDVYDIKPIIDKRSLWKENESADGETTRILFADRVDSFVYDEDGHVYCVCPTTAEQRNMFFCGFESDRQTLKYRCPAAACGFECQGRRACEAKTSVGPFGRVIRVPLEFDRRIFTPVARHTQKWEKAYDRRSAVERVNSRLDWVLGFEKHYIRGQKKMATRVTLALIVILAMALGRIRANQADRMRSLTAPAGLAA
jgi:hypothetical protein